MIVDGVLLAAGSGRRFGGPKLLAHWHGEALIRHCVRAALASELRTVHVVTAAGGGIPEALADFADERLRFAFHTHAEVGMASSLKRGLRALADDADAAMVLLADMPRLPASVIDRLIGEWNGQLLVPVCEGIERHPRLIPRAHFGRFLELDDAKRPARALEGLAVSRLEFADASHFADVDRPEDLED